MTRNHMIKLLSLCLCLALLISTVLLTTGFSDSEPTETPATAAPTTPILPAPAVYDDRNATEDTEATEATESIEIVVPPLPEIPSDVTVKGEGKYWFYLNVTDVDKTITKFLIKTDKLTLYDALTELNMITSKPFYSQLDITSVNGIPADADKDCSYWYFYTNGWISAIHIGEYATPITPGTTYSFVKSFSSIGKGSTVFYLDVLQSNNTIKRQRIRTDKETLGEALKELHMIHALPVDDGWFITSVGGIGGCYWDLYINDAYACTDNDMYDTKIVPGTIYRFARKEYLDEGKGANAFYLEVGYGELRGMPEGNNAKRKIHTDKKTIGEALQALDMITFDADGQISSVYGYRINREITQDHWELYIDGVLTTEHVNNIPINKDSVYRFKRVYAQTALGSGATTFYVNIHYPNNKYHIFQVNTDKETLWEALVEVGLITVDSNENGRYVSSVDGFAPDAGSYWHFEQEGTYKNGLFTDPPNGRSYIFSQKRN